MKNLILFFAMIAGFAAKSATPAPHCHNWVTLPAGTMVMLETNEKFSSDQSTVGKVLKFRVTTDVRVDGKVLIATGAIAVGRVKAIEQTTYNNPETITITLLSAQAVDGQQVALNGMEQTFAGQFPNQGVTVEVGQAIIAMVMNNTEIKVP